VGALDHLEQQQKRSYDEKGKYTEGQKKHQLTGERKGEKKGTVNKVLQN